MTLYITFYISMDEEDEHYEMAQEILDSLKNQKVGISQEQLAKGLQRGTKEE